MNAIKKYWAIFQITLINILSLQLLWIVVLGSILILAYRRGVAYLTVNGG